MRFLVVPSLLAALIVFAACSGGDTKTVTVERTVTETTTGMTNETDTAVSLYFLRDGKVAPEQRAIASRPDIANGTLEELLEGPASDLRTAVPDDVKLRSLAIAGGMATVELGPKVPGREAQAQIVYTLTQFPTVKRVAINGRPPVGRAAFEAQTPAILVESPLPGETVEPGFEVRGTANTFEATFNYELKDQGGRVLRKNFVTATSGSGTRGTFRFTVPYEVDEPQPGALVVFEISAADGSRINESEISLQLE